MSEQSLRCMSLLPFFSDILQRETIFKNLLASLDNDIFQKGGLVLKERICSLKEQILSLRADPN